MRELTAELVVDGLTPDGVQISPDGRWVAYGVAPASRAGEHPVGAIWLAATDGATPPRQLTAGTVKDGAPQWSNDGGWLYFLSDRTERGKAQLHRIALDGGEAEPLTDWKPGVEGFSILPDGQTVAFWAKDIPTEEDERREKERDDASVWGERLAYARLRLHRSIPFPFASRDRKGSPLAPRDPSQRKADVLKMLETEVDAWVPSADAVGTAYLIPLSFYWDGVQLVFATPTASRTIRNLRRSGQARIGMGGTRDVVIIEGPIEITAIDDDQGTADTFAARLNWDPRNEPDPYSLIKLRPRFIQAWREVDELAGRTIMRDGMWTG